MAKENKGNPEALKKAHIPERQFIHWWMAADDVPSFVERAAKGYKDDNGKTHKFKITESSAIARAARLRKSETKQGRKKTAIPLKWMGASPTEDRAAMIAEWKKKWGVE